MNYSFVESGTGKITKIDWFDQPPQEVDPAIGKWMLDEPPTFNSRTHSCAKQNPQPLPLGTTIVYDVTPKAIDQVKLNKKESIGSIRDAELFADVEALGTVWQADKRSQELLSSVITLAMAGVPLPPHWRDKFNVDMPITELGQLVQIAGAMALQTQNAYSKSWASKAQVDSATTIEEVDQIP